MCLREQCFQTYCYPCRSVCHFRSSFFQLKSLIVVERQTWLLLPCLLRSYAWFGQTLHTIKQNAACQLFFLAARDFRFRDHEQLPSSLNVANSELWPKLVDTQLLFQVCLSAGVKPCSTASFSLLQNCWKKKQQQQKTSEKHTTTISQVGCPTQIG